MLLEERAKIRHLIPKASTASQRLSALRASLDLRALLTGLAVVVTSAGTQGLTTKAGTIQDGAGNHIVFKGIGWFGFNTGLTYPGDLSRGTDSVTRDFRTIVWRIKQLGFNAVRLPFTFAHFADVPVATNGSCDAAPQVAIDNGVRPDDMDANLTTLPASGKATPQEAPPSLPGGACNVGMPSMSTRDRYIWVVKYLVDQGLYVVLDFHSFRNDDNIVYSVQDFVAAWAGLVTDVLAAAPEAQGRLLFDVVNEPDGFELKWEPTGEHAALGDIYIGVMDLLYPLCTTCLFMVEGTGATNIMANWGDGFVTDASIINSAGVSDATPFLSAVIRKVYHGLRSVEAGAGAAVLLWPLRGCRYAVVLAPHIYCAGVSLSTTSTSGQALYSKLDTTFGYLTANNGFCTNDGCHVFPALVGEFGSTLQGITETDCMQGILAYMNGEDGSTHARIDSFFYWSWQPDSVGTGGLTQDNFRAINFTKISMLAGGTWLSTPGLGLRPWYLAGYVEIAPLAGISPPPPPILAATTPVSAPASVPASYLQSGGIGQGYAPYGQGSSTTQSAAYTASSATLSKQGVIAVAVIVPLATLLIVGAALHIAAKRGLLCHRPAFAGAPPEGACACGVAGKPTAAGVQVRVDATG
ncbi:hypothetical protein WJX81_006071 [Elliptochloris bilobata]|uniref:Glycoside hydrolase family 5 domain-containing protein n=1 Tax=Elliptochloris bilobata TaxID=381761 RepID=A0AAW1RHS4_9CHLO